MITDEPREAGDEQVGMPPARRSRRLADQSFRGLALAAGLFILVILALIAITATQKALPAFRSQGLSYFTSKKWIPNEDKFGALAFIYGTLVVSVIAVIFAVPVSVGIALFVTETAPKRMRPLVTGMMDLLAAVPSVVFGLWGILVLAPNIKGLYNGVSSGVNSIPILTTIFNGSRSGHAYFTAGLILAIMITPILPPLPREVFATVPENGKNGAYALGATRWDMI